jgi:hypothetical protein
MKKIVFVALVALFALSFTLEAQDNGRNRRGNNRQDAPRTGMGWSAKDRADNMEKELGLTAEEKAKVQALFEKQDAKRAEQATQQRDRREGQTQDRAKRREEMQASLEKAMAESDAELEAIIGKEKMGQWKQRRADRLKEMRNSNRTGGRRAPRQTS